MTIWWLSDECLMTFWWLLDDSLMTSGWLSDDSQMTLGWLRDDSQIRYILHSTTFFPIHCFQICIIIWYRPFNIKWLRMTVWWMNMTSHFYFELKTVHLQGFWPKTVYLKCFGIQLKTVYLQGPHSSRPCILRPCCNQRKITSNDFEWYSPLAQ